MGTSLHLCTDKKHAGDKSLPIATPVGGSLQGHHGCLRSTSPQSRGKGENHRVLAPSTLPLPLAESENAIIPAKRSASCNSILKTRSHRTAQASVLSDLGCCRALTPRAGAHPRRSPPHALRGHGARRALRRRPLPHPPLPGVAGAAWGCPPHGAALPLHRLFNNPLSSLPREIFFHSRVTGEEVRERGKPCKLFFSCFPGRAERVCAGRDSGDLPEPPGLRAAGCPVMPSGGSPSRNPV